MVGMLPSSATVVLEARVIASTDGGSSQLRGYDGDACRPGEACRGLASATVRLSPDRDHDRQAPTGKQYSERWRRGAGLEGN
jgi:hypothetical protein